jgi:hypothetical protein
VSLHGLNEISTMEDHPVVLAPPRSEVDDARALPGLQRLRPSPPNSLISNLSEGGAMIDTKTPGSAGWWLQRLYRRLVERQPRYNRSTVICAGRRRQERRGRWRHSCARRVRGCGRRVRAALRRLPPWGQSAEAVGGGP